MMTSIDIDLIDDGTIDHVYGCYCRRCGNDWEHRLQAADYGYFDGQRRWWGRFPERRQARDLIEDAHFDDSPDCY